MPPSAQDARAKFKRFRILVVGRANTGKTTLQFRKSAMPQKSPRSSMSKGIRSMSMSNPGFVFHDSCGFEAGGEDEATCLGAHICEGIERAHSFDMAVYSALFERATSDPSQSRRRGPYLADHKISKPKSSLRRSRFPLARAARQEHRDTERSRLKPEEEDVQYP